MSLMEEEKTTRARESRARYRERNRSRIAEYNRQYRRDNKAKRAEYQRRFRLEHPGYDILWRAEHREEHNASTRQWKASHPEKVREYERTRRARLHGLQKSFTQSEWEDLKNQYCGLCVYCFSNEATEADHIVPLSRGGLDSIENIAPSCLSCNRRKHTKNLLEFILISKGVVTSTMVA